MAFNTQSLSKGLQKAENESIRAKAFATQARNALLAGNVSANAVIQIMTNFKSSIEVWDSVSSLPGIAQYTRDQYDNQAYDVVAEFVAMRTQAVAVRDWVITNFPASGGFIQKDTLQADGAITVRQFTPAQTTGLQTALADLIAAIA